MSEKCFLCEKEVSHSDASQLGAKSFQSLISASMARGDGKYEKLEGQ